ncbi:MAG: tyrosine-protein phosphatase [Streptosporangiaceae bacterium]
MSEASEVRDLVLADGRHIPLSGLYNLREVGGYPTAVGGTVRWRILFRSDALHRLDEPGTAAIAARGLRTIVDLRTQMEVDIAPSALDQVTARTTHISLLTGDLQALPLELDAVYRYIIDACGKSVGEAIKLLCAPDAFPALVHCSAGKDRTGIVIALILAVLGVPDEVIAADYGLSGGYLDQENTPAIGQVQSSSGLGEKLTNELLASPPQLMAGVLAQVRASWGSVDDYLLSHGLTPVDLANLRAALVG